MAINADQIIRRVFYGDPISETVIFSVGDYFAIAYGFDRTAETGG